MLNIPDPNVIFPNGYGTSCFVKNIVHAPNIEIGDYLTTMTTPTPRASSATTCCSTTPSSATG